MVKDAMKYRHQDEKKLTDTRGEEIVSCLTDIPTGVLAKPCIYNTNSVSVGIGQNKVTDPSHVSRLKELSRLPARDYFITLLTAENIQLKLQTALDLIPTKSTRVGSLEKLGTLNLTGRNIKSIPGYITRKLELEGQNAAGNPIENVPCDLYGQGINMLRKHFNSKECVEWRKCQTCTMDRFMKSLTIGNEMNLSEKPNDRVVNNTSDYGTCTCSESKNEPHSTPSQTWTDSSSCHGDYDSESLLSVGSDSTTPNYEDGSTLRLTGTDSDDDDSYFEKYGRTLPDHSRVLKYKKVTAIIPSHNMNAYTPEEFTLNVVEDLYYTPVLTERTTMHASQVISLGPHGSRFYDDEPALVYLPLGASVDDASRIVCLFSDTKEGEIPDWRPLPKSHYHYIEKDNKVMIRAWHFSLYTVIISCPHPEVKKFIDVELETTLEVEDVSGVKVCFPSYSLPENFEASVKVFYEDDDTTADADETGDKESKALASPVVMLGPHGVQFDKDITVQLPLPDCCQIMQLFDLDPKNRITLYQSPTGENDPMKWEPYHTKYEILRDDNGNYIISFAVRHFSWYKGVWDILASTVHGAKVGVSYFYPFIRFSMMCTAMMDETADTRSFGLEIICYRSDKKLPEVGNYRHRVGGSTKPKFVRPGTIIVKLVSQDFEADILHGENAQLCKEETDFHGLEFEKQFACIYKSDPVKKGVFGKCIVERKSAGYNEHIFEFNLTKCGNEGEFQLDNTDGWSLTATRELASMLNVLTDENWKEFAKRLGFTKHEIKNKLSNTTDPFALMMGAFQARGGTPDEFVQALYSVGRDFRLGGSSTTTNGFSLSRPSTTSGFRSTTSDDDSDTSPGHSRSSTPTRKRRINPAGAAAGQSFTKRHRSDVSDSVASSYSSFHDDAHNRSNKHPLETNDMWKLSQFINQHWKSLGRNLSVPEEDLNQVEHAHRDMRECSYQMLLKWKERFPQKCSFGALYVALCDSGLNSVAVAHCVLPRSPK